MSELIFIVRVLVYFWTVLQRHRGLRRFALLWLIKLHADDPKTKSGRSLLERIDWVVPTSNESYWFFYRVSNVFTVSWNPMRFPGGCTSWPWRLGNRNCHDLHQDSPATNTRRIDGENETPSSPRLGQTIRVRFYFRLPCQVLLLPGKNQALGTTQTLDHLSTQ